MRVAILAITAGGHALAQMVAERLEDATHLMPDKGEKVAELLARNWSRFDGFLCIMATGIVVRTIAPLLEDKKKDPCVIVCDQLGKHVISLLSGHLGGGNTLAGQIAAITGGQAVITTASDTIGVVALDIWARDSNLVVPERETMTWITTRLVNEGTLKVYSDVPCRTWPPGLTPVARPEEADIIISHKEYGFEEKAQFFPKDLVVGTGCNRGTPAEEFESALLDLFSELRISRRGIRNLASIDAKNDETGLLQFAEKNSWTIDFFDKTTINTLHNLEISFAALKAVGAIGVAEPAALLSAESNLLISRKRKWKNVTMAVAQVSFTL